MAVIINDVSNIAELNKFVKFQLSHSADYEYFIQPLIRDERSNFDKNKTPVVVYGGTS